MDTQIAEARGARAEDSCHGHMLQQVTCDMYEGIHRSCSSCSQLCISLLNLSAAFHVSLEIYP